MQLDNDNPWPGLESFQENANAFFFGRDRETESLRDHVLDAPVTVLYGRSGLGKTSLLQAALFPLLRERGFLPIYVRFELKSGAEPITRQLHHAVHDAIQAEIDDAVLPADDESLWEYLHRNDFELWSAKNYPLTPLIVLDQFEELFTLGERVPDLVVAFRDELGDLAENRIPADLATRIHHDEALAGRFNLRSRNYKLLISMREDFLPDLEGWCRLIPTLGRARVRLLRLRTEEALDAVHKPAVHLMTDQLARRVVSIIAGEDLHPGQDAASRDVDLPGEQPAAAEVEPALLSLFCRELNEERKRRGLAQFDEQLIEDAKRDTLSNYYSSCVRDLPDRVARFIESELITEKGFRDSYIREDAVPAHLTEDELGQLISARLVRLEDRYGAQRIELTHDVLTGAVREHRDRRRADEEKAELQDAAEQAQEREQAAHAMAASEQRAKLEAQEQAQVLLKRTRALRAALALVAVIAVAAGVGFGWAFIARNDARDQFRDATALRLYGDSQLALSGLRPGGSDDVLGMQMLLAANKIPSKHQEAPYPLLTALAQERDLLKVIDTPKMVFNAVFSPDGARIATAGLDGIIRTWDAVTGKQVGQLKGHEGGTVSLTYSPDGKRLASGGAGEIRLWDVATGTQIGAPLIGQSVAFSRDGRRLVSGGTDGAIRLWDAATRQEIGEPLIGHTEPVPCVAFSPDGTRVVSGSFDKSVRLWDVTTGRAIGEPLKGDAIVWNVAFSPDGTRIAASDMDDSVRLWDAASRKSIGPTLIGMSVAFSPDGTRIVTGGGDNKVRLWDAGSLRETGALVGHRAVVESVAFSPDGIHVVSSSDDNTVRLWDATTWQPITGHEDTAFAAFSEDGRRIMSGSEDGTVRRWDAGTGRSISAPVRVPADDVHALFPVNEDKLLSIGSDDSMMFWDAGTLKPIGERLRLPTYPIADLRPTTYTDKTNRIAAATSPWEVQLFSGDTMGPIGEPITVPEPPSSLDFSDDGQTLATGSSEGTIQLWNSGTGAQIGGPIKSDGWVSTMDFSPDGHELASANLLGRTLRVWNTQTAQPVGNPMQLDSAVTVVEFSDDGRTIATGSVDGSIRLWNAGDQIQLGAPLAAHKSTVTTLDFSPDGKTLLSASDDRTIRKSPVLDPSPDALCTKLSHSMTREQWNNVVSPEIPFIEVCPDLADSDDAG